MYDGINGYS
jgi:hypothetical protein